MSSLSIIQEAKKELEKKTVIDATEQDDSEAEDYSTDEDVEDATEDAEDEEPTETDEAEPDEEPTEDTSDDTDNSDDEQTEDNTDADITDVGTDYTQEIDDDGTDDGESTEDNPDADTTDTGTDYTEEIDDDGTSTDDTTTDETGEESPDDTSMDDSAETSKENDEFAENNRVLMNDMIYLYYNIKSNIDKLDVLEFLDVVSCKIVIESKRQMGKLMEYTYNYITSIFKTKSYSENLYTYKYIVELYTISIEMLKKISIFSGNT